MKNKALLRLMISCFLVCSMMSAVSAQETTNTDEQTKFGIRSVGICAGWYKPSMDYWNDTYFPDNMWENEFKGSLNYGAYLDLNIINNLRLRAGFTYWKEKVKSESIYISGVPGKRELTTSLAVIPLEAIYELSFIAFEKFMPYAGIGGDFLFVQNKLKSMPDGMESYEVRKQGQDITGHVLLGIDRPVAKHIVIGLEFRYVIGKYIQEVIELSGDKVEKDVSLNGIQIGITAAFLF